MKKDERQEGSAIDVALWAGMLGAPMVWLVQFGLNYALVSWACAHGGVWLIRVFSVLAASLAFGSGVLAWRSCGRGKAMPERRAFMSGLGVLLGALFTLLILAQGLATFFINPCQD